MCAALQAWLIELFAKKSQAMSERAKEAKAAAAPPALGRVKDGQNGAKAAHHK